MGDFHQRREAMTKDEYDQLEQAGEIRRPLTWGPQKRHNNVGARSASEDTPHGVSVGGQTPPAPGLS